ncbi:MAG: hypothetical protein R3C45_02255 [Phycisphaerales bacterium]
MDRVLRPTLNPAVTRRPAWQAVVLFTLSSLALVPGLRGPSAGAEVPHRAAPVTAASLTPAVVLTEPVTMHAVAANPIDTAAEPTLLERAVAFIEPFEGRRHRAYRDSRGNITVGVGFNLDRDGASADLKKLLPDVGYRALRRGDISLTDAQIDSLLRHDAQRAIETARRQVTEFDSLPLDAQLIVIDMTYNTGSLSKWRRFRAALDRQDYAAAADSMHRSLWRRQTGRRAEHLIELMRSVDDR